MLVFIYIYPSTNLVYNIVIQTWGGAENEIFLHFQKFPEERTLTNIINIMSSPPGSP